MKTISEEYSDNYGELNYEIKMSNEIDLNMLYGNITFYDEIFEDGTKNKISNVIFFVFDCYELDDFWYMADAISGDLEYVASAYNNYCHGLSGMGSIVIIDTLEIINNDGIFHHNLYLIRMLMKKLIEIFRVLGTGTIAFMSKAIYLNLETEKRRELLNELLQEGFIPIHQDQTDVVMVRNLDYQ